MDRVVCVGSSHRCAPVDILERLSMAPEQQDAFTADLLSLTPRLTGVVAETTGQPGAADPEHLVLRQRTGLLRGMRLSTVTGAVLGALDGDLTVGQTMAAVAQLLEVPAEEVAAEAIPAVRQALAEQYLTAH